MSSCVTYTCITNELCSSQWIEKMSYSPSISSLSFSLSLRLLGRGPLFSTNVLSSGNVMKLNMAYIYFPDYWFKSMMNYCLRFQMSIYLKLEVWSSVFGNLKTTNLNPYILYTYMKYIPFCPCNINQKFAYPCVINPRVFIKFITLPSPAVIVITHPFWWTSLMMM